jgi:multidrug efflux pump subunit AcrA (membrane-fusion protein)
VTVGAAQADGLRVIEEGLDPEDRVVISGLTGARPVVPVKPRPGEMMTTPSGDR